jgi:hypothetical protein
VISGAVAAGLAGVLATLPPDLAAASGQIRTTASDADPGQALYNLAATAVSTLTETHYSHDIYINAQQGIYDTNCSGFVDYLLKQLAPTQYRLVPREPGFVRPRAFMYEQFFSHLGLGVQAPGWANVASLTTVQPGDILAWDLLPIEQYYDTGHVVIVAGPPLAGSQGVLSLPVIDASALRHYSDSRPRGTNGLGTGNIHFQTDNSGAPTAFQFDAGESFQQTAISIGRLVSS